MLAEKIHKILTQPDSLKVTDTASVAALVKRYPYFIPARYLQVIQEGRQDAFSDRTLKRMYLFLGNWLLYYHIMQPEVFSTPQAALVLDDNDTPDAPDTIDNLDDNGAPDPIKNVAVPATTIDTANVGDIESPATQDEEVVPLLEADESLEDFPIITPIATEDYFSQQDVEVPHERHRPDLSEEDTPQEAPEDKSLMVVMSFSEWLLYFKVKKQKEHQDEEGRKAIKTMWQKEKLAAALEEEADEIPDEVFNMAVNSISREEDLISESLAEILVRQGKHAKAIDMYHKLSLHIPEKNAYFAARIQKIQKEKKS